MSNPKPIDIILHRASHTLEVAFDDGARFRLPCEYLRVESPSAEVQGHGPGQRVLVLGAGKSGALVAVQARENLGATGRVVAADRSPAALAALAGLGACDQTRELDATDAVGALARFEAAGGRFDLVVNCASVAGTEMAALLAVKDGGAVIFFSMATSFTGAALGAEGVGKDATLIIGNGYVPGHAELTLDLLRRHPRLRALFEQRYAR